MIQLEMRMIKKYLQKYLKKDIQKKDRLIILVLIQCYNKGIKEIIAVATETNAAPNNANKMVKW